MLQKIVDMALQKITDMAEQQKGGTERFATRETACLELHVISRRLAIYEQDLLADLERKNIFIEATMNATQELIKKGHYELAEKFHDRAAGMFEGIVGRIIEELEFVEIDD